MKTKRINISNIFSYIQGNLRYRLYYSKWLRFLMAKHIREQIHMRLIAIEDTKCYNRGSCVHCGCQVPHLQMANITCEGKCYPEMMSKKEWERSEHNIIKKNGLG